MSLHHRRFIDRCDPPPKTLPRIAHQLFDSGIGRAIWWVKGASPGRIQAAIDAFPPSRRPELWCGIGVACAYAGDVGDRTLRQLGEGSGRYRPAVGDSIRRSPPAGRKQPFPRDRERLSVAARHDG